jgi:uncharacterized protein (DUF2235 family)
MKINWDWFSGGPLEKGCKKVLASKKLITRLSAANALKEKTPQRRLYDRNAAARCCLEQPPSLAGPSRISEFSHLPLRLRLHAFSSLVPCLDA